MEVNEVERADRSHRNSYGLFVGIMKWGAIIAFILVMIVIFLVS